MRVGRSAGWSLPLKENHDLRSADGPHTRHRDAADDPPALGRIAVERLLQVLWTELAGPPAAFLRQHLVLHGLSTSSKRPGSSDFYRVPAGVRGCGRKKALSAAIVRFDDHYGCAAERPRQGVIKLGDLGVAIQVR